MKCNVNIIMMYTILRRLRRHLRVWAREHDYYSSPGRGFVNDVYFFHSVRNTSTRRNRVGVLEFVYYVKSVNDRKSVFIFFSYIDHAGFVYTY